MSERKLNFNAPLLSVRRFSTTLVSADGENGKMVENNVPNRRYTIPFHRKNFNLDQVTKPVAVPFQWEHVPGRAKDGSGPEPQPHEEASSTPRLPPARILDVIKHPLLRKSGELNGVRVLAEVNSLNDNVSKLDCSKEGMNENGGSDSENDEDAYSDALDTLSATDSFSLNCSVSGLSGSDGPVVKPSGTFSTDPQTRDFMMSRFLPAAKAMALQPPQYASRKQLVAIEQPREVNKVVSGDRRPAVNQYESIVIKHYGQDEEEESEDEDDDDEYDKSGNISSKACGLFPRLCFRNALCLLNPVPGMKVKTQSSMSSAFEVRKQGKAASIGSHSQSVKKHAWDAVNKHNSNSGARSCELTRIDTKLSSGSNRFANSSDQQTANRSSPFRRSRSGCVSPYHNVAPQSPFRGRGFLGIPKEAENFGPSMMNLKNKGSSKSQEFFLPRRQDLSSMSPAVEKTLYVDTVHISEIPYSNSSCSDTKGQTDFVGEQFETSKGSREMEETTSAQSSFHSKIGGILDTKVSGSIDAYQPSLSDISQLKGQANMMEGFRLDQELDQESKALVCINVNTDGNLDSSNNQLLMADDPENVDTGLEQSPLPPPLPKTPSESWLWRTLPSVSSQNPFSQSNFGTRFQSKKQDLKTSSASTKWETIVKTSSLHHDHVRYSEELISHISQQSKS